MKFTGWFAPRLAARTAAKGLAARSPIDVALAGVGVTTAAASAAFAVAMFAQGDHPPLVNGMQYLGVFGQPHRTLVVAAGPALPITADPKQSRDKPPAPAPAQTVAAATATQPHGSVDLTPTGSIARGGDDVSPADDPYRLVAAEPGMAWLRNSVEIRVIKPGDFAPGLGRVAAIVLRGGRWALIDDAGATLLTAESRPTVPFSRRMIFGE